MLASLLPFVFVFEAVLGTPQGPALISGASGGTIKGASIEPTISGDGRFVAFTSVAKLSPEDTNALPDVYVRDTDTGTLRLVSDSRGGDQPLLSADGRFVVFRALETFPRLRTVDLEKQEPPRTISFPQDTGFSFRYADTAAITPEGRFIAFPFRPIPGLANNSITDLYVADTSIMDVNNDNGAESITANFNLLNVGRSAMSRDGNTFFTETTDQLLPLNDTNSVRDIYRIVRGSNAVVRLSAVTDAELLVNGDEAPPEKLKGARDPVLTADGNTAFFITARRLRAEDTDGGATIYRSSSASNFQIPTPISTGGVRPINMSRQAVGDGQYLVFAGQSAAGLKPYILRLSDGELRVLGPSVQMLGLPAISADNGFIAFSTEAALAPNDKNAKGDVYVAPNPFPNARLPAPAVTLSASPQGGVIQQPATVNLGAQATSAAGIVFTRIELNGTAIAQATSGTVPAANFALPVGINKVRAVALDRNHVPKQSVELTFNVRPVANRVVFRPPPELTRSGEAAGGAVSFSGRLVIDNTFASAKTALQVVLLQSPNDAKWEFFGNDVDPAVREVQVLDVIKVPNIPGNTVGEVEFESLTLPPELLGGENFRGVGWTVIAKLQEGPTNFVDRDTLTLFQIAPRLNELTPGPNGGTPQLGGAGSDGGFAPATVNSVTIDPNPIVAVAERTKRTFTATGNFTQGGTSSNRPVTPKWSLVTNGVPATIAANGVLTVGDVATTRTITVMAAFGGKTDTQEVTVRPVSPAVSVRAPFPLVLENDQTFFRILRSPSSNQQLDVSYTVAGLANNPFRNGTDYTPLSGTATIPPNTAFVDVAVVPDATETLIEGNESVILTISPSGDYRVGAQKSATIVIDDDDDDPLPATVPDATIRRGNGPVVGAKVYAFGEVDVAQTLSANAKQGVPVDFIIGFVNRSNGNQTLLIDSAGADFNGFTAKYFLGTKDVTAEVAAGTVQLNNNGNVVGPGEAVQLKLRIIVTSAAPIGAEFPCNVTVSAQGGFSDIVRALVKRAN